MRRVLRDRLPSGAGARPPDRESRRRITGGVTHEGGVRTDNAPHGGVFISPMSRELYADTEAVVKNCAGGA